MEKSVVIHKELVCVSVASFFLCLYIWWITGRPDANLIAAHDYLDSIFLYDVVRGRQENFLFDFSYVIPQFSGLPLNALALRDFGIGENMYLFLSPFTAYAVNYAAAIIVSFAGFYLLGRDYLIKNKDNLVVLSALLLFAFMYAVLPHKPQRLVGIAMLPLLYWAAANIWHERHKALSWIVWLLYPFYAYLHYNGFAVALGLGVFSGILVLLRRPQALRFCVLTLLFGAVYAFVEIRNILVILSPEHNFESLRSDIIVAAGGVSSWLTWDTASRYLSTVFFLNGHHHIANNMRGMNEALWLVMASCALICVIKVFLERKSVVPNYLPRHLRFSLILIGIYLVIGSISFLDTLFPVFYHTLGIPLPLRRIDTLAFPLLSMACLLSLLALSDVLAGKFRFLILLPCLYLLGVVFDNNHTSGQQWLADTGRAQAYEPDRFNLYHSLEGRYSIKEYFLTEAFEDMADVLKKRVGPTDSYRTLSIGLSPTKAQYNGYQTIDGYFYNYPVKMYDTLYWPVVKPEFKDMGMGRKEALEAYMTRLYAPVAPANRSKTGISPHYDWCYFTKIGGRIVFSAYYINNAGIQGLGYIGQYGPVHVYDVSGERVCSRARS